MPVPCVDREQFEFEAFVKQKMGLDAGIILSAELCFCGKGIPLLYEFLAGREGAAFLESPMTGEQIFARIETDPIARETFDRFLYMLGSLLMSNCCVLLPDAGIVLCGTILSNVIRFMMADMADQSTSHFYKGFFGNPPVNGYLGSLPIYFTSERDLGLKGCQVAFA